MSYFDDLLSLKGRLNIFSIFLVATILTIFEIIFFYNIVVPDVNNTLEKKFKLLEENIDKLSEDNKTILLNSLGMLEFSKYMKKYKNNNNNNDNTEAIENAFKILINRENLLIEKNNVNTVIVSITILLFLSFFILATILSIKRDVNYKGFSTFRESIIVAFITVGLLIGFQILFYNFSQNYYYPSNNELLKIMINSLNLD